MSTTIVTGAAGFIGFHLCRELLRRGWDVVGVDNLTPYYSVLLKKDRLAELECFSSFRFESLNLAEREAAEKLFNLHSPDLVYHLAAQVGVRHSVDHPHSHVESNLAGLLNVLEGCRQTRPRRLIYASSSSVYGANRKVPFSVDDRVDHPVSLYAATKRAGELLVQSYSHLYRLPAVGMRFFTVYGPWGRPDMAVWRFTEAMRAGQPIRVFNHGQMRRDFTYVDDVVQALLTAAERPEFPPTATASGMVVEAPHHIYNIGNHRPVDLEHLISTLETTLGVTAQRELLPMQPGDVLETYADIESATCDLGFQPSTPLEEGIRHFVEWYGPYAERSPERSRICSEVGSVPLG